LAQYTIPEPTDTEKIGSVFIIGQALEADVRTTGDRPINNADAAAMQAAEARVTRHGDLTQGGL
jgi:Seed maturation protein